MILGAGLDARAWRLPWVSGSVVFEIDQPQVLEFKLEMLRGHGAEPACAVRRRCRSTCARTGRRRCATPVSTPTRADGWSAEGLLPYLPAEGQDRLFAQIAEMAVPSSRIAVEAFGEDRTDVARVV